MTGYTTPDNLPYPDDYQQPADSPTAFRSLADAVQAALGNLKTWVDQKIIYAGNGLTGGGDLSAARTIHVGAGEGILSNANDVAVNTNVIASRTYADGKVTNTTAGAHTNVAPSVAAVAAALGLKSNTTHNHTGTYANASHGLHPSYGVGGPWTFNAGVQGGNLVVNHSLGRTPLMVMATVLDDDGDHSMVTSVTSWDATKVTCTGRNLGSSAETFRIGVIVIG